MNKTLPIIFNTEMTLAILDDRKCCTRRICKDANKLTVPDMDFFDPDKRTYAVHSFADPAHYEQLSTSERTCPICQGDILYVRETWSEWTGGYLYKAWNGPFPQAGQFPSTKWHPSIHMPKEAARIWLKVTDVKVEKLQEITEEDAIKEGFSAGCSNINSGPFGNDDDPQIWTAREAFARLWDTTVKKADLGEYGWQADPWVWVIDFEKYDITKVN